MRVVVPRTEIHTRGMVRSTELEESAPKVLQGRAAFHTRDNG